MSSKHKISAFGEETKQFYLENLEKSCSRPWYGNGKRRSANLLMWSTVCWVVRSLSRNDQSPVSFSCWMNEGPAPGVGQRRFRSISGSDDMNEDETPACSGLSNCGRWWLNAGSKVQPPAAWLWKGTIGSSCSASAWNPRLRFFFLKTLHITHPSSCSVTEPEIFKNRW